MAHPGSDQWGLIWTDSGQESVLKQAGWLKRQHNNNDTEIPDLQKHMSYDFTMSEPELRYANRHSLIFINNS